MRKANRGPALFEVLGERDDETSDILKVPRWWSPGERRTRESTCKVAPSRVIPERTGAEVAHPREGVGGTVPFFELVDGRARVSFTSLAAAGVVFAAMVAVLGAFELGTRSGHKAGFQRGFDAGRASYAADAMSEIELARSQPPATHLVSDLLQEGLPGLGESNAADAGDQNPKRVEWIRGYTYVVVQEFAANSGEDVRLAEEFLAEHGVPTARVQLPSGAFQLITTQGYNRADPTQAQLADTLLEKVQETGARYFAAGGGYRLKGYFKTRKDDAW